MVCRHTAGSSPSPSRIGVTLPQRTLFGVCPTTGYTTLESTQTSRIRDASQTHPHLLPRPCTMGSRRKTLSGISGVSRLLLRRWVNNYYLEFQTSNLPPLCYPRHSSLNYICSTNISTCTLFLTTREIIII